MLYSPSTPAHPRRRTRLVSLLLAVLLVLSLLASLQRDTPTAGAQALNLTLAWEDTFDGAGINTGIWTFETGGGGWGNSERQYYTNGNNAWVSGGILTIEARRDGGSYGCWYGPCEWTSTRMNTNDKKEFRYGRMEARMALPMGAGLWPAFWMLGANYPATTWPSTGEIDIMEHVNTEAHTHGYMHWLDHNNTYAKYGTNSFAHSPGNWHNYTIEWTPNYIRWYVDGAQFHEANIAGGVNGTHEFHQKFFFLLNLAVGGSWPGMWDHTTPNPARFYVDYVRVWQGVAFFQDSNYGGAASGIYGKGDYASLPAGVPNDWMTSLRVPDGWTVYAYEHGGFGGAVCTYTGDSGWVGSTCNDKMSSFKIR